jgi:hypothetical protein
MIERHFLFIDTHSIVAKDMNVPPTSICRVPLPLTLSPTIPLFASQSPPIDHITPVLDPSDKMNNQSALDAITIAINNFMAPTLPTTQKSKRMIERPYGESLTSVQALVKIQEKENKRKKVATKPKQATSGKRKATATGDTKPPPKKR